jgi:simple sugar transport system ATP-binding protein
MRRLHLEKISLQIGSHKILSEVDFEIKAGEVLALLGDNGAGKSSLIKIISGFHLPTSGEISWEGDKIDSSTFNPKAAQFLGIQTVYQHLGLVDALSIARNFFLGREPIKKVFGIVPILDQEFMNETVREKLREMKISRTLNPELPVAFLSGGERQAIAIARARYFGAKLLILDEPTSALSLKQTNEVLSLIETASKNGLSVIFITHTLHHIKDLVNTVFIMKKGQIVAKLPAPVCEQTCASWVTEGLTNGANSLSL